MKLCLFLAAVFSVLFTGCASMKAYQDLNETPENIARGDPNNNLKVREYLQTVLSSPDEYEVKAYSRRPYSTNNRKNMFSIHSFYVYFKSGQMEHTLVFTATPKWAESNGSWMLDAHTDVDSYELFVHSPLNPWEVEEYKGPGGETALDTIKTTRAILERQKKAYSFFGAAHVRNFPWYHILWLELVPPPVIAVTPILVMRRTDNCNSALLETMVWKQAAPNKSEH